MRVRSWHEWAIWWTRKTGLVYTGDVRRNDLLPFSVGVVSPLLSVFCWWSTYDFFFLFIFGWFRLLSYGSVLSSLPVFVYFSPFYVVPPIIEKKITAMTVVMGLSFTNRYHLLKGILVTLIVEWYAAFMGGFIDVRPLAIDHLQNFQQNKNKAKHKFPKATCYAPRPSEPILPLRESGSYSKFPWLPRNAPKFPSLPDQFDWHSSRHDHLIDTHFKHEKASNMTTL